MKKQKIIAMILVFLTVVTVAGIVNANVPTVIGAKKTENVGNKIVNGSNGKLNPQGTATRAEAAAMISNYCNTIK